jgi:dTDP-4-dehydrorhamnose reductase
MKTLLLGPSGQVGSELQRTLLPFGELFCLGRKEADLTQSKSLENRLRAVQPTLIVNAAAYTAVDKAESDSLAAFAVNADSVKVLADYARGAGALFVHYSTDYVFDGIKSGRYLETDLPGPLSVYGRSKLAGEEAILASGCDALIFRTSWVYSVHGSNFIKTILRLGLERESLEVVADQWGAPTSAELLADVTALAVAAWRVGRMPGGVYHLAAKGETHWQALACFSLALAQSQGWPIRTPIDRIQPISTAQFPRPASRPLNSRLSMEKLEQTLQLQLPDWKAHVTRMIQDPSLRMDYPILNQP